MERILLYFVCCLLSVPIMAQDQTGIPGQYLGLEPPLANNATTDGEDITELAPVRILCIGNSYSRDMVESGLPSFAKTSNIQLVVGNAARAGYGLRHHWQNLEEGRAVLEYCKLKDGIYTSSDGHTLAEIIRDEPWDYVTFQQNSEDSGLYSTYTP